MAIADFGFGAQIGLRQLLAQRVAAQLHAEQMAQQQFENQRQLASDQRAVRGQDIEQQRYGALDAERQAAQQERQAAQQSAQGDKLNESIPGDTRLNQGDKAVGFLRAAGVPLQDVPAVPAMGSEFQGPMQNGVTPQQAQTGIGAGFLKTASAKQQQTASEEDRKRQADAERADNANWRAGIQQQVADAKAAQPASGGTFQLQPELDATGKPTGKYFSFNTKTNSWSPVAGQGPQATKAAPGAAQAAQSEQAKHDALGSLDQLDQAIEAARNFIGPGAGRVSSIQQMVGNPDPRISALGTKMLLAKMQVDHAASGTVRAGASPQILSRWDNILGNNQTPEGLKAAVQAMREILGGQTATATAPKKTAEDLIRQYGGGR